MIWEAKKEPKIGDTKRVKKFALIPTKIAHEWYWLEPYEVEYLYISRNYDSWVMNKFWYKGQLIEDRNIPAVPPAPNPPLGRSMRVRKNI